MSDAINEPAHARRAVRPSKEAALARAKRRRGPVLTRRRRRASMEWALCPPAALVEWIDSVCDAPQRLASLSESHPRRYLQLVRFVQFGCAVSQMDGSDDDELARLWARHAGKVAHYIALFEPPTPWELVTYVPIAVAALARLGVNLDTVFPD